MVYDLSFELNHTLWDNFFLSTGTKAMKQEFFKTPGDKPLPNGRIGLFSRDGTTATDLTDFHRAASRLSLEGGVQRPLRQQGRMEGAADLDPRHRLRLDIRHPVPPLA